MLSQNNVDSEVTLLVSVILHQSEHKTQPSKQAPLPVTIRDPPSLSARLCGSMVRDAPGVNSTRYQKCHVASSRDFVLCNHPSKHHLPPAYTVVQPYPLSSIGSAGDRTPYPFS